ncbi:MAG: signal peptidase I [Sphingobium sp.]|nr:signal peptidase I [Sphingobium sp.]
MRKAPAHKSSKSETKDFILFLLKLTIFVVLVRSLIASPFNIPSESMQPRLLIGDYLLVAKWPYGYSRYSFWGDWPAFRGRLLGRTPERGDVVVFASPANPKEDWIKRVIGLPGDRVQMREGVLYLNGLAVPKKRVADLLIPVTPNMIDASNREGTPSPCYQSDFEVKGPSGQRMCRYPRFRETLPNGKSYDVLDLYMSTEDNTQVFAVPEGQLFVMGDNRDRSADSRFSRERGGVAFLPQDHLVGRAMVSFFATDGSADWKRPWTIFSAARTDRIGEGF